MKLNEKNITILALACCVIFCTLWLLLNPVKAEEKPYQKQKKEIM
ncbi:hypothetical protein [Methanocaldococcus villosus]|nr:hypothetical protein [Methanocaldococcus villosus]